MRFPPALRVLYRIHDGQQLDFDAGVDAQRTTMHPSIFHGLFGGWVVTGWGPGSGACFVGG